MYKSIVIIIILLLITPVLAGSSYTTKEDANMRNLTIVDRQIVCSGHGPAYFIVDANGDTYEITSNFLKGIIPSEKPLTLYNKLRPNTTHLVQVTGEFYIWSVVT